MVPIILDLVLLAKLSVHIQLKIEGEDYFLLHPYGTLLLLPSYDMIHLLKGCLILQGKFHSIHLVATIFSYLTKAPLVSSLHAFQSFTLGVDLNEGYDTSIEKKCALCWKNYNKNFDKILMRNL